VKSITNPTKIIKNCVQKACSAIVLAHYTGQRTYLPSFARHIKHNMQHMLLKS